MRLTCRQKDSLYVAWFRGLGVEDVSPVDIEWFAHTSMGRGVLATLALEDMKDSISRPFLVVLDRLEALLSGILKKKEK